MFKKITALAILGGACISTGVMAYTTNDVSNANYLAEKGIIRNWTENPSRYNLDSVISRVDIVGMALDMAGIQKNNYCRQDFFDVDMGGEYSDWVCRTMETAADYGLINGQTSLPRNMRRVKPYHRISRSEALGIFMNAFPISGAYAGYSYYLNTNFPIDGSNRGYTTAYNFGAPWQATVFYSYIRNVLQDDTALRADPRVNDSAKLREIYDFAVHILNK